MGEEKYRIPGVATLWVVTIDMKGNENSMQPGETKDRGRRQARGSSLSRTSENRNMWRDTQVSSKWSEAEQ